LGGRFSGINPGQIPFIAVLGSCIQLLGALGTDITETSRFLIENFFQSPAVLTGVGSRATGSLTFLVTVMVTVLVQLGPGAVAW
jgi:hypothetical protein